MTVEKLKTAIANINAYLSECHDDDDTVTLTANVIRSVKENYEELIRYKEDEINPEKSRWISVKDRLPEENVRVLVLLKDHPTRIDTDRIVDSRWVRWNSNITHWMPLPEPPEGGAEK